MPRGKIVGFRSQVGSGLGEFCLKVEGKKVVVPCDAGATLRSLHSAFPTGVWGGKLIDYELDDLGVMLSFTPVEEEDA